MTESRSNFNPFATDTDLADIPSLLGRSDSQRQAYITALGYLNQYLTSEGKYPRFLHLTQENLVEDNLIDMLEDLAGWFAKKQFFTKQKSWLGTDSKLVSFGLIKELFRHKFREHDLWKRDESTWWTDLRKHFKKACNRYRMENDNISEGRKMEPLYRNISERHHGGLLRAKYHGLEEVDARLVAMSLMKKGDPKSLLEFNLSRSAVARGGEHRSLRWDEGAWDWFFDAPDFDWKIPKQLDRQPMLFFHDMEIFCLDVFLSFALFGMFGGFERPPTIPEARKPYVFPYLHDLKKDYVAERMTKYIRSAISDVNRKKAFTSRSMRKGSSTELAVHRDITNEERYSRGGWTGSNHLTNAEGYVDPTPNLNAPAGLALAGYKNCHDHAHPPRLDSLGPSVSDETVARLLDTFFPNDIPELAVGGNLRPLIQGAAAAMLRHYKAMVSELGFRNVFVKKIHELAKRAKIEDASIPVASGGAGQQYLAILNCWSEKINDDFKKKNLQREVPKDAPLELQLHAINADIQGLRNTLEEYKQDTKMRFDLEYQSKMALLAENQRLMEENDRLKQKLGESTPSVARRSVSRQNISPDSTTMADAPAPASTLPVAFADALDSDSNKEEEDEDAKLEAAPPHQKRQRMLGDVLDAAAEPSTKIGGIEVFEVFVYLWEHGYFKALATKLAQEKKSAKDVPRSCLFDSTSPYYLPVHPVFKMSGETNKYSDAMKIVALSILDQDWQKIIVGEMTDKEHRNLFSVINKSAKETTRSLEIECGIVEPKTRKNVNRIKPTVSTLGLRFQAIRNHFKTVRSQSVEATEEWVLGKLGEQKRRPQQLIEQFFSLGAKKNKRSHGTGT